MCRVNFAFVMPRLLPLRMLLARRVATVFIPSLLILLGAVRMEAQRPASTILLNVVVESSDFESEPKLLEADFEISEGRAKVPITSFAGGSSGPVRPLLLWFVVQCPEERFVSTGSGFMLGKTEPFTSVLQKLPASDVSAVAHWCDDGTFGVDLAPTSDREAPARTLHSILSAPPVMTSNTPGQNALHDVVERMHAVSLSLQPQAMPVLVFLYGDTSGMWVGQLEDTLRQVLRDSAVVYELDNGYAQKPLRVITDPTAIPKGKLQVVHYLVEETGGQVYSTWTNKYRENLDRLIGNLHRRYELGFTPSSLDGQRHEITIKLTAEGHRKLKSAKLRYASTYLAVSPSTRSADAPSQQDAALALALGAMTRLSDVRFDASGRVPAGEPSAQFRVYIDPQSLVWLPMESSKGDVQAKFTLAAAFFTTDRAVLASQMKDFAVARAKDEQSAGSPQAVIVDFSCPLPAETSRIRFVVRDSAGHLGSFDLASAQIKLDSAPSGKHR